MSVPPPGNTSGTARLMVDAPSLAIGWQRPIVVASPAAGAQWSRKTNGNYYERLISVTFTLVTSAVVASRFPSLTLTDNNGAVVTSVPAGNAVAANTTLTSYLARGGPQYAGGSVGTTFGFLPDILTPPDYSWSSQVANMDVGDQIGNIVLLIQQFPNDAAAVVVAP